MINPAAVKAFLARAGLSDSRKAKRFTEKQLDEKLAQLDPPLVFETTTPAKHQKVCILLGIKYPAYAFWLDMGGRKTSTSLWIVQYLKLKTLVLVPYSTNVDEWVSREVPKHCPRMKAEAVTGTSQERFDAFWTSKAQVVVCTYAGFLRLMCTKVLDEDDKPKLLPDQDFIRMAAQRFECVVADEPTVHLSSHTTLAFRILKKMRKMGTTNFYELTGTPFGEDPHPLWSQFYLIDFGETLGATLGLFRAIFYTTKQGFWGGYEHTYKKALNPLLHRWCAHRSIRYESEEFEDLPPITGGIISKTGLLIKTVHLSKEAEGYYASVIDEIRAAQGNHQEMENAWHRMRRLSSGYALPKDDDGETHPLVFKHNPKLELLISLLQQIPMGRQALVFCYYRFTGELLVQALKAEHYKVGLVLGGQGKKNVSVVQDFLDHKRDIMVCNEAAGFGLNLQVANYAFFFETPTNSITRRQMEKRLPRGDQKHHVFIYDLAVKRTVDMKILQGLETGVDVFEEVVAGRLSL